MSAASAVPGRPGLSRRGFVAAGLGAVAVAPVRAWAAEGDAAAAPETAPEGGAAPPFGFNDVVEIARNRAGEAHDLNALELKPPFADLGYDGYRQIAYRRDIRLLQGEGAVFAMDLLPPGLFYRHPVEIAIVRGGQPEVLPFSADFFDFRQPAFDFPEGRAPEGVGRDLAFTGFRLRYPLNSPDVLDEFCVFQGASYFRAVARNLLYGISARGLAIGTADPKGEEFPVFSRFWVHEPAPGARSIQVDALLESPSLTGAFSFAIQPGETTVMDVRCRLFPRVEIGQVGLAPLTSMYYFGPERRAGADDFRNAVHDSDALQMITGGGRRLYRQLRNPSRVRVSFFRDESPQGFGLCQRRRDFAYYQDAEARYDRRPSAWIEPLGKWGPGAIMLIEIPVDSEYNDNIVAFWRPEAPLQPTPDGHAFEYRLHWCDIPPDALPLARVAATRSGRSLEADDRRLLVVDFALGALPAGELKPRLWTSGGEPGPVTLRALPGGELVRAAFDFAPGADLIEFQLTLDGPDGEASETWMYQWTPR